MNATQPNLGQHHPLSLHERHSGSEGFNLKNILRALRRRWLPALVVGVLASAAVAAGVWFFFPRAKLTCRSLVKISYSRPANLVGYFDGFPHRANNIYTSEQITRIKGRFVLMQALQVPEVAQLSIIKEQIDPVQWLERQIRAEMISPELLSIHMEGSDPAAMTAIINAVTKTYLKEAVDKERIKKDERLKKLNELYTQLDKDIKRTKEQIQAVLKGAGIGTGKLLQVQQEITLLQLGVAKSELARVHNEMRKLRIKLDLEKKGLPREWSPYLFGSFPSGLPTHLALGWFARKSEVEVRLPATAEAKIQELLKKDDELAQYYKRKDEVAMRLRAFKNVNGKEASVTPILAHQEELIAMEGKISKRTGELRPYIIEQLKQDGKGLGDNSLWNLQTEYEYYRRLEQSILADINVLASSNNVLSERNIEYDDLKETAALKESYWKMAVKSKTELELEHDAPSQSSLYEEAVLYTPDVHAKRVGFTAFGGAACFGLILFSFGFFGAMSGRLDDPRQFIQGTGMKLMGTLPDYSYFLRLQKKSDNQYDSMLTDSVDAIRTMLLFVSKMENVRTVMVTSAGPGEGKTSSACHLAASLARVNRRVLLIDADLRKPSAHMLFGLEQDTGLSEVLCGTADVDQCIRPTNVENLSLLSAGSGNAEAVRSLALDQSKELFKQLRDKFDFIVVDSSPVLPVPDALLVAQHVDAVVFSVLRDVSKMSNVQSAYGRLSSLSVRILGAIFNGSQDTACSNYSYSKLS
jgi:polysaccharide biosynthesis transport protein